MFNVVKEKLRLLLKGDGIKSWWLAREKELFYGILLILVAVLSFGLGRLTKIEETREPVRIENPAATVSLSAEQGSEDKLSPTTADYAVGMVIASKRGKKYYFPWCSGVQSLKEENKITFSEAEAGSRGYTLSATCSRLGQ